MSKTTKKRILAGSAIIALGLMFAGATASKAASTTDGVNPMSNLIHALATKFNLNETEVKAVFDEQRVQMEKEHEQLFTNRLTQAIADGKLTQEQVDKITAKKAELETLRTSLEGKTEDEKRAAVKTQMDALKDWATENNIPAEFMMFGKMGGAHGMKGGMMKDDMMKGEIMKDKSMFRHGPSTNENR
ncbi:MAG: hypothetical protein KBB70_02355 [Candidatus Pacebacteria bacterium]|nr:hypothetical protein [Candidatus Paceibacterota bacterium]